MADVSNVSQVCVPTHTQIGVRLDACRRAVESSFMAFVENVIVLSPSQEKRNLNRMALNPSRTLGGPPPPLRSAAVATTLTQNLEDNPRAAALVQRGLLKTEDV